MDVDVNVMSEIHLILHIILYAICLLIAFVYQLLILTLNKINDREFTAKGWSSSGVSLLFFIPLELIYWVLWYFLLLGGQ